MSSRYLDIFLNKIQVTPVTAPARVISTPSAPPVDTIPPLPAPSQLPSLPTLPVVSPGTSLDAPPPISRKLKPASPGAVPVSPCSYMYMLHCQKYYFNITVLKVKYLKEFISKNGVCY